MTAKDIKKVKREAFIRGMASLIDPKIDTRREMSSFHQRDVYKSIRRDVQRVGNDFKSILGEF